MKIIKRAKMSSVLLACMMLACACGAGGSSQTAAAETETESQKEETAAETTAPAEEETTAEAMPESKEVDQKESAETSLPKIDMTAWQYNEENDVYWQTGIRYCETPADESYETLGLFIPGAYMKAEDNGDGTYTCTIDTEGETAGYTAATAPVVIPVETPGYSAMSAPDGYQDGTADYTAAGFVYLYAGCRGRDQGAPAGVTDLKAAIRYYRYNKDLLPGDADSIYSFGMSGGGAQSALLGATGDSELYTPYLEMIGAVSGVSDAVRGSMCWCPITNLDTADAAYEWNLGASREGLNDREQKISDALAASYADYINSIGLTDEQGTVLTLEASEDGIFQAGSYYDYIKEVIETSLEHFLEDTEFPYDTSASSSDGGGMGGPGGAGGFGGKGGPGREKPADMDEKAPAEGGAGDTEEAAQFAADGIGRSGGSSSGMTVSGVFETPQDYVDALNAEGEWISYDAASNTVSITSVEDFVTRLKTVSKSIGAFDQLDAGQGENTLFGYGDGSGAHFDSTLAEIVSELAAISNDAELQKTAASYEEDMDRTDAIGSTVDYRLKMYTPMYYLISSEDGYQSSNVAEFWRIRTGISQGDTALSTEVNLALALEAYDGVESVDFETVWGKGHTEAERTGSPDENFIAWVNSCQK